MSSADGTLFSSSSQRNCNGITRFHKVLWFLSLGYLVNNTSLTTAFSTDFYREIDKGSCISVGIPDFFSGAVSDLDASTLFPSL